MMSLMMALPWTFEPHGAGAPFSGVRLLIWNSTLPPAC